MGRHENRIDPAAHPALRELAYCLRCQRSTAGLTYRQLAKRTHLSVATLNRAASGTHLPSEETVAAFMKACDATALASAAAHSKWRRARREIYSPGANKPNPELVNDKSDLSVALEALWQYAGRPSLRNMQAKAGGSVFLPASSAARIRSRKALPASRERAAAYLRACAVAPRDLSSWLNAWDKVVSTRRRLAATPWVSAFVEDLEKLVPMLTHQESTVLSTVFHHELAAMRGRSESPGTGGTSYSV
ncbi:helix-turn-helix domain-containing protein [Streptomyces sp. TRM70308]|uniref:helix-turn-helix domain-containing protein n=1 Tax=Streptomyces sp. TRM70308 TaxID=3131932 RepID=UPI003D035DE0